MGSLRQEVLYGQYVTMNRLGNDGTGEPRIYLSVMSVDRFRRLKYRPTQYPRGHLSSPTSLRIFRRKKEGSGVDRLSDPIDPGWGVTYLSVTVGIPVFIRVLRTLRDLAGSHYGRRFLRTVARTHLRGIRTKTSARVEDRGPRFKHIRGKHVSSWRV